MNDPIESAIKRMASQGKAGRVTVAAPLNDMQLIALMAAAIHGPWHSGLVDRDSPQCIEDAVREAVALFSKSIVAVQSGYLKAVLERDQEEERAAIAARKQVEQTDAGTVN
jgi:hypothetical protein